MQTTNQKGIVKLTKAQYNTLITTGSVTDGSGQTFTYQDGYVYCTDEVEYVSFAEPQLLTPEQQAQARANIGAGGGGGGTEVYVNGVLQQTLNFDSDPQTQISGKVPTSRTIAGLNLSQNRTATELRSALNVEDGAEVNEVNDIEIDDVSCVTGTTAEIRTINGDYNASTNRLATASDVTSLLKGNAAPTTSTVGKEGQIYLDTVHNLYYICNKITSDGGNPPTYTYTWKMLFTNYDEWENTTSQNCVGILSENCRSSGVSIGSGTKAGFGVAIGNLANADADFATAIGWQSKAAVRGTAIGKSAEAGTDAVQLGRGTAPNNTFCVGLSTTKNYLMLTLDGKIPQARFSNCLSGAGSPTTSTTADYMGQLYKNTTNNDMYICKTITEDTSTTPSTFTYTWESLVSSFNNYEIIDRPLTMPTASATSPDFVQVNGVTYKKVAKFSSGTVADLTGTRWLFNDTPTAPAEDIAKLINFTSNNESFTAMVLAHYNWATSGMIYGNDTVYNSTNGWTAEGYKEIVITDGRDVQDSTLIDWLSANATQVTFEYNALINTTSSANKVYGTDSQGDQTTYDVGEFDNLKYVTNCVLEAPNGIATYSGGTLTIKAGLKVLIPNGRNADGTLNNKIYTLPSDISTSITGTYTRFFALWLSTDNSSNDVVSGVYFLGYHNVAPSINSQLYERYFNTLDNQWYYHDINGLSWNVGTSLNGGSMVLLGYVTSSSGTITNIKYYNSLSIPTETETRDIASQASMVPGTKSVTISVSAGTNAYYTAPANGYIAVDMLSTVSGQRLFVFNDTSYLRTSIYAYAANQYLNVFMPIKKGETVTIYSAGTPRSAYFVYAEEVK